MGSILAEWSDQDLPVIGMVHLLPLPGSPRYGGDMSQIESAMLRDVEALVEGGVHGLILENFGDAPFARSRVAPNVVSHMTALAMAVRQRYGQAPLGINVLRNDGCAALAIAHAVGAQFIRVNVLCGVRLTDQGLVQAIAHDVLRDRAILGNNTTARIFADVDVKHSAPLGSGSIEQETKDVIERGLADAVIVSGPATGDPTDRRDIKNVKLAAASDQNGATPVFVGSGVTSATVDSIKDLVNGLIVGTFFKRDGIVSNPVDPNRVQELMQRL